MFNAKQKRLTFILYIGLALSTVGILAANIGLSSPWPWLYLVLIILVPLLYIKFVQPPYVQWRESYVVGVAEIDYDHKRLLELINRVVSASSYDLGIEYTREIFDKLLDYTKYHFYREEALMEKYDFPGTKNHIRQHRSFIDRIDEIQKGIDGSINVAHHEVFDFLKSWLVSHICVHDRALGLHINKTIMQNAPEIILSEENTRTSKKKASKKGVSKKPEPEPVA